MTKAKHAKRADESEIRKASDTIIPRALLFLRPGQPSRGTSSSTAPITKTSSVGFRTGFAVPLDIRTPLKKTEETPQQKRLQHNDRLNQAPWCTPHLTNQRAASAHHSNAASRSRHLLADTAAAAAAGAAGLPAPPGPPPTPSPFPPAAEAAVGEIATAEESTRAALASAMRAGTAWHARDGVVGWEGGVDAAICWLQPKRVFGYTMRGEVEIVGCLDGVVKHLLQWRCVWVVVREGSQGWLVAVEGKGWRVACKVVER